MFTIKTVGVLLRDNRQNYPLDQLKDVFGRIGATIHILNHGKIPEKLDLVIAMGGDGTVLQALDLMPGCPVLAINFGTVGFLTAGDRTDLERVLERLLAGDFRISERILLKCQYGGGVIHAVNEVIIRSSVHMIQVEVYVDDTRIRTIRGDGVIMGTPTGSTGYLLSTGAPLVMPEMDCFILDGINEYNFTSRALIVAPDSSVRLHIQTLLENQEAHLMVDGKMIVGLKEGEDLILTRSERRAQLIFFEENYFFHNLSSRLSWN